MSKYVKSNFILKACPDFFQKYLIQFLQTFETIDASKTLNG